MLCSSVCAQAPSNPETTSAPVVVPGPLQPERSELLDKIHDLESLGVGIKPYLSEFSSIENLVRTGSETDLKAKLDRLNRAVSAQHKPQRTAGSVTPSKEALAKLEPYCQTLATLIKQKWKPVSGVDDNVEVVFSVDSKGNCFDVNLPEASRGARTAQERVKRIVSELKNVGVPPAAKFPLHLCLNCCDQHGVEVTVLTEHDVDFSLYMKDLQERIKREWFPPRDNVTKSVQVCFRIHSDGKMSRLQVTSSSGMAGADQAALHAVQRALPFRPLPKGSPHQVDIEFTLDYNVWKKGKKV